MRQALAALVLFATSLSLLAPSFAAPRARRPARPPAAQHPRAAPGAAAQTGNELPPPPPVSDPMLAPVPPPKRMLASWQQALSYARARSADLRTAVDVALQAEAQTRIALAAYLPTITGTGIATHNFLTKQSVSSTGATVRKPTPNYLSGNIQLQQAIIDIAALDQISIDELNEDAAHLSVDDQKRTLALSIANSIVGVVIAERSAEISRGGLRVALEQLEIAKQKRSLGVATGLDIVRAQQNAANARATLVTADETLHEIREALGLALGFAEEVGVTPNVNLDGIAEGALRSCRAVKSLDERADVAQARTNSRSGET